MEWKQCRLWTEFPSASEYSGTAEFLKNGWVFSIDMRQDERPFHHGC
jgi:hypothetical protein